MKKMKLYHGSSKIITKPIFGLGKQYNDYGRGFYCTQSMDMAMEWAVDEDRNGFANCYSLDLKGLDVLDLNSDEYCILHWLTILLENREFDMMTPLANEAKDFLFSKFAIDYKSRDIIIGYRADDSYFSFARDFLNGGISYRQLSNAMCLGELGVQVVLKSEKAFAEIEYLGSEMAESEKWYPLKKDRDDKARKDYFDVERNKREKGDCFITRIIDEEMSADDLRI